MNWKSVLRDALLIFLLTAVGGFLVAFFEGATGGKAPPALSFALSVVLAIFGFAISGSLTRVRRWRHLLTVAAAVWLLGLVNLALGANAIQWLSTGLPILIACGIGGALAALLIDARNNPPPLG